MGKFKEFLNIKKYNSFVKEIKPLNPNSIGKVNGLDIFELVFNKDKIKTIIFCSTIHGDENSGTDAIIKFIKNNDINHDYKIVFYPLINPTGFVKNTRNNLENKDINRGFWEKETKESGLLKKAILKHNNIEIFHSIHEDNSKKGFYLYSSDKKIAKTIVEQAKKFFPILDQETIYGDSVKQGIVTNTNDKNPKHYKSLENWVDSKIVICTEVPDGNRKKKIDCNYEIIKTILK